MRDDRIDILRFVGLAMIIFAHVGPPGVLFQLRNFDVPLMVLLSGMSFGLSFKSNESYREYIWKRIKRLVFPVWIFLSIYFFAQFIFNPASDELNIRTILTSYTLVSGIGYVWIIKVFLLVALVSPFLYAWHTKTQSNLRFFLTLASYLLLYEILRHLSLPHIQEGFGKIVSLVIFYIIPFSIVFTVGIRMLRMSKTQLLTLSLGNFGVLIFFGIHLFTQEGKVIPTQTFKYPPSIYYLSYALFVSGILWAYSEQISSITDRLKIKRIIIFSANNSIWIYLWHIPLIKVINTNFALKYFLVFLVAIAIMYIQVFIVKNVLIKDSYSSRLRKNITTLLTG